MILSSLRQHFSDPTALFIAGWCVVMLALMFGIGTPWITFIHFWRVDWVASVFLLVSLGYVLVRIKGPLFQHITRTELLGIVLPILSMILWSAASIAWSKSWKSAAHYTGIWCAYLVFYLFIRNVIQSRNGVRGSLGMLVVCLGFAAIPALFGYLSYQIFGGPLDTGINFQKSGEQVTMLLPLLILTVLHLDGRKFVIGVIGIALMWLLVLCALGRINMILFATGFLATSIFAILYWPKPAVRRRMAVIALMIVVIPVALFAGSQLSGPDTASVATRIVGDEGTQSSNSFRKLMTTLSLEMIASSPIIGVGADNFGFRLNEYRAEYGRQHPDDPNLALGESEIPERAHNELLQILAELGIVGGAIVAWLVIGFLIMAVRSVRYRLFSLFRLAALFGVGIFLVSSLVSSYSFRLIQHGFVFFFLLAICSSYFLRDRSENRSANKPLDAIPVRPLIIAGMAACLLLFAYSSVRVASVIATRTGDSIADIDQAKPYYEFAMKLDNENPDAPNTLGMRLFFAKQFSQAAPYLDRSVRIGRSTSTSMSYLASAYTLAGDNLAAEKTMARAVELYPRSPFVLVRYASLVNANGNSDAATAALHSAKDIDRRAANTWSILINQGSLQASEAAFQNEADYVKVMDLKPNQAIYAVLDEKEINSPGSRPKVSQ